jgi:hypothetical protein
MFAFRFPSYLCQVSAPNNTTRTIIRSQTKEKHLSIKDINDNSLKNTNQLRMKECLQKIGMQETKEELARNNIIPP